MDWSEGITIVLEMDWSSGHGRKKSDGLDANAMHEKFGGKQPRMHGAILAECDVGPHPAEVAFHLSQAAWGAGAPRRPPTQLTTSPKPAIRSPWSTPLRFAH